VLVLDPATPVSVELTVLVDVSPARAALLIDAKQTRASNTLFIGMILIWK